MLSECGAYFDLDIDMEVPNHLLDNPTLLVILLTEEGPMGLDDFKEFRNDCGNPSKVNGTGGTAEVLAQFLHLDEGLRPQGIHPTDGGEKEEINPRGLCLGSISAGVPRITLVVFHRTKLGGVDKDGKHHDPTGGTGSTEEGEVPLMEETHRGYKSDGPSPLPQLISNPLHGSNTPDNLHGNDLGIFMTFI